VNGSVERRALLPQGFRRGIKMPWFSRPPLEPVARLAVSQRSRRRQPEDWAMTILKWALIFFLVSIVAGLLGFTGLSAASADVARFLFYVFVVIFLVLLILGLTIFRV
jgi:uncharacterized membrane protein YtjA (UPF0391 family)